MAQPAARIAGVSKRLGGIVAVDGVSLDIALGELFALLGPSGSGKTTLLRLIGGFETPDAGRIEIDGQDVTQAPPYARPVNMVFQSYALFPHMSVWNNVAFGLRRDGLPRAEIARRVRESLDLVQLAGVDARRPAQLSGGQRQRVALARALAKRPKLLLLDEPLSALDRKLRDETRGELVRLQQRLGLAFILVTHDQEEAMGIAQRMAVLDRGRVIQSGSPREIYERPATRFVAGFIGRVNLLDGLVTGPGRARCEALGCEIAAVGDAAAGASVSLAIRPEQLVLADAAPSVRARVTAVAFLGETVLLDAVTPAGAAIRASLRAGEAIPERGAAVGLALRGPAIVLTS
jgi:putrescine transport system ATP-binding protein